MKVLDQVVTDQYALYNADAVEAICGLPDNAIDLSVSSPPFAALYTYSDSERDMGNCASDDQFFEHYRFLIGELLRATKPGRVAAVHVFDIPATLIHDGYIGLKDFSGDVIRAYIAAGWVFDARIAIDKNQQAQSIRTHAKGLTMTQMEKDRTWSRPALPDYILKFRKPGENAVPVVGGEMTRDLWIDFANPTWPSETDRCAEGGAFATWYGIRETATLTVAGTKDQKDEKHIAPLQIETVKRCVWLWSNQGETVYDPFGGIGTVPAVAVRHGRKGVATELKPIYFQTMVRNVERAAAEAQLPLLAALEGAA